MYHKAENWLELHNLAKLFMKSQLKIVWTAQHMFFYEFPILSFEFLNH